MAPTSCVVAANKLFKSLGPVFLTFASTVIFFVEELYDGENPGIKCRQGKDCGFDRLDVRGRVENDRGNVDGGTGTMTEHDQSIIGVVTQLLLRTRNGAWV